MISMRYHIVSLAAIFLALALGIVLGATKISSPILAGLQSDKTDLSSQNDTLSTDNTSLTARVSSDDKFAASVASLSCARHAAQRDRGADHHGRRRSQ